jgi:hypothetical protein
VGFLFARGCSINVHAELPYPVSRHIARNSSRESQDWYRKCGRLFC